MTIYIAPIVEGQTEAGCVERLLQRVWAELLAAPIRLQVLLPSRGNRDALIHQDGTALATKIAEAHAKLSQRLRRESDSRGMLLLLLDAEADCPAQLAPRLLHAARQARSDATIACVLAKRMLENWIVAGAATLAGMSGLPKPLQSPANPEDCSGAAWLEAQLRNRSKSRKYKKTTDAKVFIAGMDLEQCRKTSPSFDKLCRDLSTLLPRPPVDPEPTAPADTESAPSP